MKTSKFTKLLPAVLALMLVCPTVFAAPSKNATSQMSLTVPPFINITKEVTSVESSTASFNDTYSTITLSPTLAANFKVINNHPGQKIYLSATAPVSDTATAAALYGTDGALKIVFTNNDRKPTATQVANITGGAGTAIAENPNAVAFAVTATEDPDEATGATAVQKAFSANKMTYTISNGVYAMNYAIAANAEVSTFSTHDTDGTYKATITLTDTNL